MKLAMIAAAALLAALSTASADTCVSKAVDKNGKPLAGAAKTSFIGKCKRDAEADCETKAIDKNGKPLSGAAKTSNVKKCVSDAVGG
jgi:curli biogenesis system outer membrane secretion channel CsgG